MSGAFNPHTDGQGRTDNGGNMPSFEQSSGEIATPTSQLNGDADDLDTEPSAPIPVQEAASASARMLELAAVTADQLVNDAKAEVESVLADLERERETALARLADEKADLEAQIATLRQIEAEQRSQMRRLLTEQLSHLRATRLEPPAGGTD